MASMPGTARISPSAILLSADDKFVMMRFLDEVANGNRIDVEGVTRSQLAGSADQVLNWSVYFDGEYPVALPNFGLEGSVLFSAQGSRSTSSYVVETIALAISVYEILAWADLASVDPSIVPASWMLMPSLTLSALQDALTKLAYEASPIGDWIRDRARRAAVSGAAAAAAVAAPTSSAAIVTTTVPCSRCSGIGYYRGERCAPCGGRGVHEVLP